MLRDACPIIAWPAMARASSANARVEKSVNATCTVAEP